MYPLIQIQVVYTQYEHDSIYNHVKPLLLSLISLADRLIVKFFQANGIYHRPEKFFASYTVNGANEYLHEFDPGRRTDRAVLAKAES